MVRSAPLLGSHGRLPTATAQLLGLAVAGLRSARNSCWRSGSARRLATMGAPGVGVLVWVAATPIVEQLLRHSDLQRGSHLLGILSALMVVLVAFTLGTSVSFALAAVYFARDVEWLLVTPISPRLFLAHRLLSQLLLGVCIGAAVGGPVVLGAAVVFHSPGLIPMTLVVLCSLLVVPMALALLAVVSLVRVVPASRVKDAAAILVGLVGFGVAAVDIGATVGSGAAPGFGVGALAQGIHTASWLPSTWAATSLLDSARGQWEPAILLMTAQVALAVAVAAGAIWVAGPMLREGWFRSQMAGRRRSGRTPNFIRLPPALAVVRKDWRTLRRDPAQLIQLLLPIGLFGVYLLAPRNGGVGLGAFHSFPIWYGPLVTSAFAALFAASGLGLRAVGSEGRQFWCLRTAPLPSRTLLLGKLALPALVATGASLVLMITTEVRVGATLGQMAFSAILLAVCVLGLSSLSTGLGAVWPRLDWTDPRRAVGIWMAILFMVVGAAYIAVCVVALTLGLLITSHATFQSEALALLTCGFVAGVVSLAALRAGNRSLGRMDI